MKTLGVWMGGMEEGQSLGGNYLYVSTFATDPNYQGRGCGTALIDFLALVADTDGVVSYLETAGERNCGFYAAKGGYQETGRSSVANFKGTGVCMKRQPFTKVGSKNVPSVAKSQVASQASA